MAKLAISNRKLIAGAMLAILASSAILIGIKTMITDEPQIPEEPLDNTGPTEPSEETGAANETEAREPQNKEGPPVPKYISPRIDLLNRNSENWFTVIRISDTQKLSDYDTWGAFTEWIASVKTALNVKMIIHTGDIVEHCYDTTEWERANASMGVLLEAGIPYTWCTGNHDVNLTTFSYIGSNYLAFNTSTFETQDYWLDSYNDRNTAVTWTYGDYKFIVINLEWHANSTAMTWFIDILDTNKESNVIVATHSYINTTGGYDSRLSGDTWELALKGILDDHSNVMFTLNGHHHGVYRTTVNDREQILFNYQTTDARIARIMTFDITSSTVYVWTYLQYCSGWDLSSENAFSFNVELI